MRVLLDRDVPHDLRPQFSVGIGPDPRRSEPSMRRAVREACRARGPRSSAARCPPRAQAAPSSILFGPFRPSAGDPGRSRRSRWDFGKLAPGQMGICRPLWGKDRTRSESPRRACVPCRETALTLPLAAGHSGAKSGPAPRCGGCGGPGICWRCRGGARAGRR